MIEIYYTNASRLSLEERFLSRLSSRRLDKIEKQHFENDRKLTMAAGLLTGYAFSCDEKALNITLGSYGKPALSTPADKPCANHAARHISLSHSGSYAVCAVSSCPIGVDIENHVKRDFLKIGKRFHEEEKKALCNAADLGSCFFKLWTLKESYIKLIGKGLSCPLDSFYVSLEPRLKLIAENDSASYKLFTFDIISGYTLSACIQVESTEPKAFAISTPVIKEVVF